MKKFFMYALAFMAVCVVAGCSDSDDSDNNKTTSQLSGVYLSASNYAQSGYGRAMLLNEDGTTEHYFFSDKNVKDGVSVDTMYTMKGTWKEMKAEYVEELGKQPEASLLCEMALEGSPETITDLCYILSDNGKKNVYSTYYGYDEFYKLNSTIEGQKDIETLKSLLVKHVQELKEAEPEGGFVPPHDGLYSNWTTSLPDDVHLLDMSIPGSHDALTYRCTASAQTQTESIEKQFRCGSRWFDVRCYLAWMAFEYRVYPGHGKYGTVNLCWTILNEMEKLLSCVDPGWDGSKELADEKHGTKLPKEMAIIRIRFEGPNYDCEDDDYIHDWLNSNLFKNEKYAKYFIPYRSDLTLGECRGKIVVMYQEGAWSEEPGYITWGEEIDHGQDDYEFAWSNLNYVQEKVNAFKDALYKNRKDIKIENDIVCKGQYNYDLCINHCTGYLDNLYHPVEFSHYVYPEILKFLKGVEKTKTYGIVPMDYIGRSDAILENLWYLNARNPGEIPSFTVNTEDLIEQIVKSNDIFKNATIEPLPLRK